MKAYFQIIRPLNLLIIILTQVFFRFFIIETYYKLSLVTSGLNYAEFSILVFATLCIAAGGYVINDFYDSKTDQVNKPEKVVAEIFVSRNALKIYYAVLTSLGILSGMILAIKVHFFSLGLIFPAVAIMLWFYSSEYQKTVVLGNLAIAIMSGLVVLIVWLFEFFALRAEPLIYTQAAQTLKAIGLIAGGYAIFAFLVTLIREIFKDIEDLEGDTVTGLRTLPVVFGKDVAKTIALVVVFLSIGLLAYFQFLIFRAGLSLIFWYLMVAVQPLFLYQFYISIKASEKEDFHFLSNVSKIIMVAGILSMQLFYISF